MATKKKNARRQQALDLRKVYEPRKHVIKTIDAWFDSFDDIEHVLGHKAVSLLKQLRNEVWEQDQFKHEPKAAKAGS